MNRLHFCPLLCRSVIIAPQRSRGGKKDSGLSFKRFLVSNESCTFLGKRIKFSILLSVFIPLMWCTDSFFDKILPKCCPMIYLCSYTYSLLIRIQIYPLVLFILPVLKPFRLNFEPQDFEQNFAVSFRYK